MNMIQTGLLKVMLICLFGIAAVSSATVYEAEDAVLNGAVFADSISGYTGNGFVDYRNSSDDYIKWTVNSAQTESVKLSFRYALLSGDRPLSISVNGQVVEPSLSFPATGSFATWDYTAIVTVDLIAGINTIRATAIGSSGANLDHLLIEALQTPPVVNNGENLTLFALVCESVLIDVTVADEGGPYIEDGDPNNPGTGTPYPLEYTWLQQSGPGTVVFSPASADVQDVDVAFPQQGFYELRLEVSDAPAGVESRKTTTYIVTVEVREPIAGDINCNWEVNLDDLIIFADQWLLDCPPMGDCADLDASGLVEFGDYSMLSSNWLGKIEQIVINEFMASNSTTILDGNGESSDWIEFYNMSAYPVDMGGMYLTDDDALLTKWRFPANTIVNSRGYLLVFASNREDIEYPYRDGTYLHTNFNLNAGGEYLALIDTDGTTVIHEYAPQYPDQVSDISYGRYNAQSRYFITPTPLAANSSYYEDLVSDTTFNVDRGLYDEPFDVTIACDTPGATIHYTTDGSKPGDLSTPYSGPIRISTTTCLRAFASIPGWLPSNIDTHTYIFLDDVIASSVMDTEITQDPRYAPHMRNAFTDLPIVSLVTDDTLPDNQAYEVGVSVEWILADGSKGFQENAGAKYYGGRFTSSEKESIRLYFRSEYGCNQLNYPLFEGFGRGIRPVEKFDQLNLRSGRHDMNLWELGFYMSNRFADDTMLDMGHLNPHGRFVHVFLDGTYWGQYHLRERWNADMHAEYLGGQREDYEAINGNVNNNNTVWDAGTAYDGDGSVWEKISFVIGEIPATPYKETVMPYIDLNNYIDFMLLYIFGSCENEYRCVGPIDPNGSGFKWFFNDADGFTRDIITTQDRTAMDQPGQDKGDGPGSFFSMFLSEQDPDYDILLADRIHKHFFNDGLVTPEKNINRLLERCAEVERSIIAESARWGYRTPDSWKSARDKCVNDVFPYKTTAIVTKFKDAGFYPDVEAPVFYINGIYQHGGKINSGSELSMSAPTGLIYCTFDGSDPRLPGGAYNPNAQIFNSCDAISTNISLVDMGSNWKYLYDGSNQGTAWRELLFSDETWASGLGQLGFGDSDETTNIGPQVDGRITAYFRRIFSVADVSDIIELTINLLYDDGAVIYINNNEVGRVDMPEGTVFFDTLSAGSGGDNATVTITNIAPSILVSGDNILAVEIHQKSDTSSDISFDMSLDALVSTPADICSKETLSKSTLAKARVLEGSTWSALNEAVYAVGNIADSVRISEIMYHPPDPNTEFIELQNVGTESVNLNLAQFIAGINHTFGNITIDPNGYVLLVRNQPVFESYYAGKIPDGVQIIQWDKGALDNDSDRIQMTNALGQTTQLFTYKDGWYELTDGSGFSLTIRDPQQDPNLWDQKSGWRSSVSAGGTPGSAAVSALAPDSIVISEILAHSHGIDPDWIELHNTTGQDINIGGWFLSDNNNDDPNLMTYEIPAGTVIDANSYAVFIQDVGQPGNDYFPFGLSEAGETVYLTSGENGAITGYYQTEENFDASETGVTFGRYEKAELTSGYDFTRMMTPTQGAANSGPAIPDIVITEIHYNPPEGGTYEFVELYNRSGSPVTLMSPADRYTSPTTFVTENIPWRLEGTGYEFPANTTIPAGGRFIVAKDPFVYGGPSATVLGPYDGQLSNGGEQVELQIPGDWEYGELSRYWIPIEKIDYDDAAPWPTTPDGGGDSLQRINDNELGDGLDYSNYGRDYSKWQAIAPTPGS